MPLLRSNMTKVSADDSQPKKTDNKVNPEVQPKASQVDNNDSKDSGLLGSGTIGRTRQSRSSLNFKGGLSGDTFSNAVEFEETDDKVDCEVEPKAASVNEDDTKETSTLESGTTREIRKSKRLNSPVASPRGRPSNSLSEGTDNKVVNVRRTRQSARLNLSVIPKDPLKSESHSPKTNDEANPEINEPQRACVDDIVKNLSTRPTKKPNIKPKKICLKRQPLKLNLQCEESEKPTLKGDLESAKKGPSQGESSSTEGMSKSGEAQSSDNREKIPITGDHTSESKEKTKENTSITREDESIGTITEKLTGVAEGRTDTIDDADCKACVTEETEISSKLIKIEKSCNEEKAETSDIDENDTAEATKTASGGEKTAAAENAEGAGSQTESSTVVNKITEGRSKAEEDVENTGVIQTTIQKTEIIKCVVQSTEKTTDTSVEDKEVKLPLTESQAKEASETEVTGNSVEEAEGTSDLADTNIDQKQSVTKADSLGEKKSDTNAEFVNEKRFDMKAVSVDEKQSDTKYVSANEKQSDVEACIVDEKQSNAEADAVDEKQPDTKDTETTAVITDTLEASIGRAERNNTTKENQKENFHADNEAEETLAQDTVTASEKSQDTKEQNSDTEGSDDKVREFGSPIDIRRGTYTDDSKTPVSVIEESAVNIGIKEKLSEALRPEALILCVTKGELNESLDTAPIKGALNEASDTATTKGELNEDLDTATIKGQLNEDSDTATIKGDLDTASNTATTKGELNKPSDPATIKEELANSSDNITVKGELNEASDTTTIKGELNEDSDTATMKGELTEASETATIKGELNEASDTATIKGELDKASNTAITKGELNEASDSANMKGELDNSSGNVSIKGELNEALDTATIKGNLNEDSDTATVKEELNEASDTTTIKGELDEASDTATVKGESNEASDSATIKEVLDNSSDNVTIKGELNEASGTITIEGELNEASDAASIKGELNEASDTVTMKEELDEASNTATLKEEINEASNTATIKGELNEASNTTTTKGESKKPSDTATMKEEFDTSSDNVSTKGELNEASDTTTIEGEQNEASDNATIKGDINEASDTATVEGKISEELNEASDAATIKEELNKASDTATIKGKLNVASDTANVEGILNKVSDTATIEEKLNEVLDKPTEEPPAKKKTSVAAKRKITATIDTADTTEALPTKRKVQVRKFQVCEKKNLTESPDTEAKATVVIKKQLTEAPDTAAKTAEETLSPEKVVLVKASQVCKKRKLIEAPDAAAKTTETPTKKQSIGDTEGKLSKALNNPAKTTNIPTTGSPIVDMKRKLISVTDTKVTEVSLAKRKLSETQSGETETASTPASKRMAVETPSTEDSMKPCVSGVVTSGSTFEGKPFDKVVFIASRNYKFVLESHFAKNSKVAVEDMNDVKGIKAKRTVARINGGDVKLNILWLLLADIQDIAQFQHYHLCKRLNCQNFLVKLRLHPRYLNYDINIEREMKELVGIKVKKKREDLIKFINPGSSIMLVPPIPCFVIAEYLVQDHLKIHKIQGRNTVYCTCDYQVAMLHAMYDAYCKSWTAIASRVHNFKNVTAQSLKMFFSCRNFSMGNFVGITRSIKGLKRHGLIVHSWFDMISVLTKISTSLEGSEKKSLYPIPVSLLNLQIRVHCLKKTEMRVATDAAETAFGSRPDTKTEVVASKKDDAQRKTEKEQIKVISKENESVLEKTKEKQTDVILNENMKAQEKIKDEQTKVTSEKNHGVQEGTDLCHPDDIQRNVKPADTRSSPLGKAYPSTSTQLPSDKGDEKAQNTNDTESKKTKGKIISKVDLQEKSSVDKADSNKNSTTPTSATWRCNQVEANKTVSAPSKDGVQTKVTGEKSTCVKGLVEVKQGQETDKRSGKKDTDTDTEETAVAIDVLDINVGSPEQGWIMKDLQDDFIEKETEDKPEEERTRETKGRYENESIRSKRIEPPFTKAEEKETSKRKPEKDTKNSTSKTESEKTAKDSVKTSASLQKEGTSGKYEGAPFEKVVIVCSPAYKDLLRGSFSGSFPKVAVEAVNDFSVERIKDVVKRCNGDVNVSILWVLLSDIQDVALSHRHSNCAKCFDPIIRLTLASKHLQVDLNVKQEVKGLIVKNVTEKRKAFLRAINSKSHVMFVPPIPCVVIKEDLLSNHKKAHDLKGRNTIFHTASTALRTLENIYVAYCKDWTTMASQVHKFDNVPQEKLRSLFNHFREKSFVAITEKVSDIEKFKNINQSWVSMMSTLIQISTSKEGASIVSQNNVPKAFLELAIRLPTSKKATGEDISRDDARTAVASKNDDSKETKETTRTQVVASQSNSESAGTRTGKRIPEVQSRRIDDMTIKKGYETQGTLIVVKGTHKKNKKKSKNVGKGSPYAATKPSCSPIPHLMGIPTYQEGVPKPSSFATPTSQYVASKPFLLATPSTPQPFAPTTLEVQRSEMSSALNYVPTGSGPTVGLESGTQLLPSYSGAPVLYTSSGKESQATATTSSAPSSISSTSKKDLTALTWMYVINLPEKMTNKLLEVILDTIVHISNFQRPLDRAGNPSAYAMVNFHTHYDMLTCAKVIKGIHAYGNTLDVQPQNLKITDKLTPKEMQLKNEVKKVIEYHENEENEAKVKEFLVNLEKRPKSRRPAETSRSRDRKRDEKHHDRRDRYRFDEGKTKSKQDSYDRKQHRGYSKEKERETRKSRWDPASTNSSSRSDTSYRRTEEKSSRSKSSSLPSSSKPEPERRSLMSLFSASDKDKEEYKLFDAATKKEFLNAEEELKKDFLAECKTMIEVPDLHPDYEERYGSFMEQYEKLYSNDGDMEECETMFLTFWKDLMENKFKREWKLKRKMLIMEYQSKAKEKVEKEKNTILENTQKQQHLVLRDNPTSSSEAYFSSHRHSYRKDQSQVTPVPSPSASNSYGNTETEKSGFSLAYAIRLLNGLCSHIGDLGPALKVVVDNIATNGVNDRKSFELLTDCDAISLLQIISERMKNLGLASPTSRDLSRRLLQGSRMCTQMVEHAKDQLRKHASQHPQASPAHSPSQHSPASRARPTTVPAHGKSLHPPAPPARPAHHTPLHPPDSHASPASSPSRVPFHGVDVTKIAKATQSQDSSSVIRFIKTALAYEGVLEPRVEDINEIFQAVSSLHFQMAIE